MNKRQLIRIGIIVGLALAVYLQKSWYPVQSNSEFTAPQPVAVSQLESGKKNPFVGKESATPTSARSNSLMVRDMVIRDIDGGIAFRGDVDLAPTLERIRSGRSDSHENDGKTFGNFERKLPQKQRGYYNEYVVRTPNIRHAGPQRLVIGQGGEIYYTPDHYQTFRRITR